MSSITGETDGRPNPPIITDLKFHPHFKTKKAGDVILQADDELKRCFYFRLALLSELSSFFATLPPPSDVDLVDGCPLIPLNDVSSYSLSLSLHVLVSTRSADTYCIDLVGLSKAPSSLTMDTSLQMVIGSAIFAKVYDIPHLFSLLITSLQDFHHPSNIQVFLRLAIWAFSGVESKIEKAAEASLGFDITIIPENMTAALLSHVPTVWSKIQDLHARHTSAIPRLHTLLQALSLKDCTRCQLQKDQVVGAVAKAKSVEAVEEAVKTVYESNVACFCLSQHQPAFNEYIDWFRAFSSKYNITSKIRAYGLGLD